MNKPIVFAGVDPGKTGALALYHPDSNSFTFVDWPKDDNIFVLIEEIQNLQMKYNIQYAILEKVSAVTKKGIKQGVKSMFSFGTNYGTWNALLAVLKIPYKLETPQSWQKGLILKSDGKDPKARSKNVATRLWPKIIPSLKGSRGGWKDGRTDAALIAYKAAIQYENAHHKHVEKRRRRKTK